MPDSVKSVSQVGLGGVNVDKDPLDLTDQELRQSQNATFTNLSARQLGLVKRPGLQKFNTLSFGAAVLGGMEAPYQNTAGAPTSGGGGGGAAGDPGGAGNGSATSLAPGDSISTQGNGNPATAASTITNNPSTNTLFGGTPLLMLARHETSGANASIYDRSGWYLTAEGFTSGTLRLNINSAASGALVTSYGPPGYNADIQLGSPAVGFIDLAQGSSNRAIGQKLFTTANGALYYPEQFGSGAIGLMSVTGTGITKPAIRMMSADGTTDKRIIQLPDNLSLAASDGSGVARISLVTSMVTQWNNGDAVFIAVVDCRSATGTTISGRHGRVLYLTGLDSGNYAVTEIFNSLTYPTGPFNSSTADAVPYTLANFMGELWIGSYNGSATGTGAWFGMYTPKSGFPNGWGFSHANPVTGGNVTLSDVSCMQEYSGALYIGTVNRGTSGAQIFRYGSDATLTGVFTGVPGASGTVAKNYFSSMEVFSGALFAAYFNATGASGMSIYRTVNGATGTWTGAFTGNNTQSVAMNLKAYNSFLYAWGGSGITTTSESFIQTKDGVTWTDNTANVAVTGPSGNTQTSAALGILFRISQ